jgi:DNA-binding LacI/PurR family transcriptional regulator
MWRDSTRALYRKPCTAADAEGMLGLYLAARERGLRIPADLSVIGFDDMDFARVLAPPLTTVALDAEKLGETAFGLLQGRMAGRRTRKRVVLPAELLVRGSTGAPG